MEVFVGLFIENDPDKSGFGVWPEPKVFLIFSKEDYYV